MEVFRKKILQNDSSGKTPSKMALLEEKKPPK